MEFWHRDKELHEKIGITRAERVTQEVAIYGDTDSISANSNIHTDQGNITIEELYNESQQSAGITVEGHESVISDRKILNWDNSLYFAEATRIIRHKVTKPRWRLKLKNGKTIDVTNDHSMIVFRDNKKISVAPSEILKSDKILCVAIDK
jgi:intein/homing endonuclease